MKKRILSLLVMAALILSLGLSACTNFAEPEEESAKADPAVLEQAISDYLASEVSKDYDKADAFIPTVCIVGTEETKKGGADVYGDFWADNYNIIGNKLFCTSGGHYPGVMHLTKKGGAYKVTSFDVLEDGADYDESAKKLFGDYYDAWQEVSSDGEARAELRTKTIADYVKANDLDVTQYQDYGREPVTL